MTKEQKEQCLKIAQHYGQAAQFAMLQEECAELIQAVSKIRRDTPGAYEHFIDELADVSIMVQQMLLFMDADELTTFYKKINEKLTRQLKRIEKGE